MALARALALGGVAKSQTYQRGIPNKRRDSRCRARV
jgi:hypothetical protein